MLISYTNGQTSVVLRVKLRQDTTGANPGNGKTGLTNASSGLIISTIADNESGATAYAVASSKVETISTLGTYAAPTATKCRFKEVDATNHPGIYEIQLADARFAVSNAKSLLVSVSGVSGMSDCDVCIPLTTINPYVSGGNMPVDIQTIKTQTVTCSAGVTVNPNVGTATHALVVDASGFVTVATNNDKTGYSLAAGSFVTATFGTCDLTSTMKTSVTTAATAATPTVTAGTVSDKTGYSLAVTPPTAATIAVAVWDQNTSGHTTSGTFGNAVVAAGSAGDPWSTSLPGSYGAGTAGFLVGSYVNASVAAVKSKTDNLPSDPASQAAILTTALTEGYAADGAAATLPQLLYMIFSALMEVSISGTAMTCKKLDGTTTAMTVTLNDATNPTSRTRTG